MDPTECCPVCGCDKTKCICGDECESCGAQMPFKSKKQRAFLYANKPEIAKKWSKKYGSKIAKK